MVPKDGIYGIYGICRGGNQDQETQLQCDLEEILILFSKSFDESIYEVNFPISAGLFYMGKQLKDFIIDNWNSAEHGKYLDLIFESGESASNSGMKLVLLKFWLEKKPWLLCRNLTQEKSGQYKLSVFWHIY